MTNPATRAVAAVHHRLRADDLRDHAAAVDISAQHHRHIRRRGKAHVGDVAGAQVDLGRAAGALDDHQIMRRPQPRWLSSTAPSSFGFSAA